MATPLLLKRRRQELGMTQTAVAKAIGVSQPTYQNYEAGSKSVPAAAFKRLAKVLKLRAEEIGGKTFEFSRATDYDDLPSDYWGNLVVNFTRGKSLVLEIDQTEQTRLTQVLQRQGCSVFFDLRTLSNQMAAVRWGAVTGACLIPKRPQAFDSLDESVGNTWDTDEPEFWDIVQELALGGDYYELDAERIEKVSSRIGMHAGSHADQLIDEGKLKPEEREAWIEPRRKLYERVRSLACDLRWQLSCSGQTRTATPDYLQFYGFCWIGDHTDPTFDIHMLRDLNDQVHFINLGQVDYLCIPTRAYQKSVISTEGLPSTHGYSRQ